jgi:hypothetical protein
MNTPQNAVFIINFMVLKRRQLLNFHNHSSTIQSCIHHGTLHPAVNIQITKQAQ